MAQVTARKRGSTWEYRFEGASINGKRKQYAKGGFKTKKEAIAAGTEKFNQYNKTGTVFEPKDISFSDYLDFFYDSYVLHETKPNTQIAYKIIINTVLKPTFGTYKLQAITPIVCQDWLNSLIKSDYRKGTINEWRHKMSKALEYAVTPCNFIPSNPMRLTRFSSKGMAQQQQETHVVSAKQFEIILKNLPSKDSRLLFILAWTLGLRAGEACGLTWDKVDFEKGIITIDRQLQGRREDSLYMATPKTEKSIRKIPFGDKLAQILIAEKQKQEKDQVDYGEFYYRYSIGDDGYLKESDSLEDIAFVCRRENGKPFKGRYLAHIVEKIVEKVGFHFTFHWLRHSNATNLLDMGLEIKEVQSRLGHSDINVTYNTYIHNTEKMEKRGALYSDRLLSLSTK